MLSECVLHDLEDHEELKKELHFRNELSEAGEEGHLAEVGKLVRGAGVSE